MKLPSKTIIEGAEWDIVIDKSTCGGSFSSHNGKIVIGTSAPRHILRAYLHEVIEAIITTRGCRYDIYGSGTNDRVLFSFYHHEFENIITDVELALKGVIKDEYYTSTKATKDRETGKEAIKAKRAKGKAGKKPKGKVKEKA